MIRLFIAFGEWLKLNFNVLSENFISLLSVDIEWHGRNESCWPKWPENINWPSGPIFAQFDWPTVNILATGQRLHQPLLLKEIWWMIPIGNQFRIHVTTQWVSLFCIINYFFCYWKWECVTVCSVMKEAATQCNSDTW